MANHHFATSHRRVAVYCYLLALSACSEKTPPTPTGSYSGVVRLYDEFGRRQADASGVAVTDRDSGLATATAADGTFTVHGLSEGERAFAFAKPGYGTFRRYGVPVRGVAAATDTVALGQVSTTACSLARVVYDSFVAVQFYGQQQPASTAAAPRARRIFFKRGSFPEATPDNYEVTFLLPPRLGTAYRDTFQTLDLGAAGVGAQVYYSYAIYGDNPAATPYREPVGGKWVFPGLSLTGTVSTLRY